jgi:hypothetical protein
MRSSKQRSRNKNNRNRSVGNIVNRVFDSSGPEGKVRGTPQQIIDKYNQLARDAQLSNDRVAAENFQQHAEHYLRLLSEAQREQDARREAQADRERNQPQNRPQNDQDDQSRDRSQGDRRAGGDVQPVFGLDDDQPDVDTGLVETPETAPRKPRRPRKPKAEVDQSGPAPEAPEAAE